MDDFRKLNRRRVLKVVGAGTVGIAVGSGSSSASSVVETIELVDTETYHGFDPDDTSVTLDAGVQWVSDSVAPHNVVLEYNGRRLLGSAPFEDGETWTVYFMKTDSGVKMTQSGPNTGGPASATVSGSLPIDLTMRCDLHDYDGFKMRGTLGLK